MQAYHMVEAWRVMYIASDCSGMDEGTALFILNQVISNFIEIVTEEARTLPDNDGEWYLVCTMPSSQVEQDMHSLLNNCPCSPTPSLVHPSLVHPSLHFLLHSLPHLEACSEWSERTV